MKNKIILLVVIIISACTPKYITSKENYIDGKLHGEYVMYAGGNPYKVGNYRAGKRTGEWKTFYGDGRIYEKSNYVDDKLQGEWIGYHSSQGIRETGSYIEDKKTGEWITYYEEGETYLGRGEDGDPDFTTHLDQEYGQTKEKGEYIEGKKNGKWLYYHRGGNLLKIIEYEDDMISSTKVEEPE